MTTDENTVPSVIAPIPRCAGYRRSDFHSVGRLFENCRWGQSARRHLDSPGKLWSRPADPGKTGKQCGRGCRTGVAACERIAATGSNGCSAGAASPGATPPAARESLAERASKVDVPQLAKELGVGELLLRDLLNALTKPRRDPRDDLSPPLLRRGVLKLEDLKPGMELSGTVLNVVDFGAFVDIGISDSALMHISRLADHFVRDPHEVVSVGDTLRVWVLDVERDRRRVALTAVPPGQSRKEQRRDGQGSAHPATSASEDGSPQVGPTHPAACWWLRQIGSAEYGRAKRQVSPAAETAQPPARQTKTSKTHHRRDGRGSGTDAVLFGPDSVF